MKSKFLDSLIAGTPNPVFRMYLSIIGLKGLIQAVQANLAGGGEAAAEMAEPCQAVEITVFFLAWLSPIAEKLSQTSPSGAPAAAGRKVTS